MYQNYPKTQSDACLICNEPLLKNISFVHLIKALPICSHCLNQFQIIDKTFPFYHYPLHILYFYNEFFKSLLFQYKGLYDYALKDVFLCLYHDQMMKLFKDYIIVVTPSSQEDNDLRGFAPMETIARTISQNVFIGLYKKEKYKQSDLRYEERSQVNEKIGIKNGHMLKGKKVLIMDDVITSGNTLLTCLSLVLLQEPQCVELLVLSTKKDIETFAHEEGNLLFSIYWKKQTRIVNKTLYYCALYESFILK